MDVANSSQSVIEKACVDDCITGVTILNGTTYVKVDATCCKTDLCNGDKSSGASQAFTILSYQIFALPILMNIFKFWAYRADLNTKLISVIYSPIFFNNQLFCMKLNLFNK